MQITAIETIPFKLPVRRNFRWAGLKVELGTFVLVRIETNSGLVGYGEATPLPDWGGDHDRRGGETVKTVIAIIRDVLAPRLIGADPTELEANRLVMMRAARGNSYAKTAVDIALHDLWGKEAGLPLYKLLGGKVRNSVQISHMVGIMPHTEALTEAVAAVGDGIRALQIKGGEDGSRDINLVQELRQEIGDGVLIRLDANQGYRDPKRAISYIKKLEAAGVDIVEQPVSGHAEMARVTRAVNIPIIADESSWDAREALDLIVAEGADYISIYLAKAAGITGAKRVAAVSEAAGFRCDVNGSIESAIGNAANLHFALATPAVELPCVIPVSAPAGQHPYSVGGHYYEDDIAVLPFPVADGALLPLDGPGLGIDIDEEKLAKFRIDT